MTSGFVVSLDNSGNLKYSLNGTTLQPPSVVPCFSVYQSSGLNQVVGNGSSVVILNTKQFDTNNNFDAVTTYRFTPTIAGYYQFSFGIFSIDNNITNFRAELAKNGSAVAQGQYTQTGIYVWVSNSSALVYLNGSTDYVQLRANNGSGVNITLISGLVNVYLSGFLARSA